MGSRPSILVLLSNVEAGRALATELSASGITEAQSASNVTEAIRLLRSQSFDLLLAGTGMQRPSAVEFLAKTREFMPRVLRALYEETRFEGDLRRVINAASPCAILSGPPDPVRLAEAVQAQRALIETASQSIAARAHRPVVVAQQCSPSLRTKPSRTAAARPSAPATKRDGTPAPATAPPAARPMRNGSVPATHTAPENAAAPPGAAPAAEVAPVLEGKTLEMANKIEALLEQPTINLPVLPSIAMEVRKLVSDENVAYERIAQKVALDQAMSARVLEVANSPLYATTEPARNLQSAISRIGIHETRNILQAVVAEGMFRAADKRFSGLLNQLWLHNLAVAYGNEILARILAMPESQDFFMMGLLHDIGKLLILYLLGDCLRSGQIEKEDATDERIQAIFLSRHNDLGLRLMKKWGFADGFRRVTALHNDDSRVSQYEEAVVVTYYSNLLARKVGLSLCPHDEALLDNKQIAQALNMTAESRSKITEEMTDLVDKIKESYLRK